MKKVTITFDILEGSELQAIKALAETWDKVDVSCNDFCAIVNEIPPYDDMPKPEKREYEIDYNGNVVRKF
jgi:hypothetical protein